MNPYLHQWEWIAFLMNRDNGGGNGKRRHHTLVPLEAWSAFLRKVVRDGGIASSGELDQACLRALSGKLGFPRLPSRRLKAMAMVTFSTRRSGEPANPFCEEWVFETHANSSVFFFFSQNVLIKQCTQGTAHSAEFKSLFHGTSLCHTILCHRGPTKRLRGGVESSLG